jgi:hypothetical protein
LAATSGQGDWRLTDLQFSGTASLWQPMADKEQMPEKRERLAVLRSQRCGEAWSSLDASAVTVPTHVGGARSSQR